MSDLSEIKRLNEQHAMKFGKASSVADRLAEKQAKRLRVKASQQRARLLALANQRIKKA